ncbi:MAG: hypothetical protein AAGF01_11445 [Cyanobacteria bacterium P01_G01_bin.38]
MYPHPESLLWDTSAGEQWLNRLAVAAIYVFGIKRGVGAESLCEFFHKLRIEHHVGVLVSSLRKIQGELEEKILSCQIEQQKSLSQACEYLPAMCVDVDETWLEQTILVMMELGSGYLLVEEMAADHSYTTWQKPVQAVLKQWGGHIQYCVNDSAKALIKLALNDLGCPSIADLFHAMRKLTQDLALELDHRWVHLQGRLRNWQAQVMPDETVGQTIQAELSSIQAAQADFRQHLMRISLELHPFDVETSSAQTTQQVTTKLAQQVTQLKQFKQTHHLKDAPGGIDQFSRQINDFCAVVDVWWQWVHQFLAAQTLTEPFTNWITTVLLPLCYRHYQTQRTDKPALKAYYQAAYQQAQWATDSSHHTDTQ